ncbi:hypothetical protein [Streptomyces silvisoli]|uniref:Uncharacterized protein n=1 Tax=Streptomyces silvisoli TaxID=3034235 RepID=A0ABT5ZL97_9ACTN|nr:hypothetical protein [Streptomyces silvisoli]MDF3290608.1 hypothetical protein [Streptomyces silvisoli]
MPNSAANAARRHRSRGRRADMPLLGTARLDGNGFYASGLRNAKHL